MNNCKKTIKLSDITTTPIKLKYAATYSRDEIDTEIVNGFSTAKFTGTDIFWFPAVNRTNETIFYDTNPAARYNGTLARLIKHLYYENYLTGSLLNSSSYWDWNQQSTACSGSSEYEYRYYPTATITNYSDVSAEFAYIKPEYIGEQIARGTFQLRPHTGNSYYIIDDGNGNLIDRENNNVHIGNIIYSHAMIIITNPNYFGTFTLI